MESVCTVQLNCQVESSGLVLEPTGQPHEFRIIEKNRQNSQIQILGTLFQEPDSPYVIELFQGRGGFMGVISAQNGLRYFALPGSEVLLPGTQLRLEGEPITDNHNHPALKDRPERKTKATQAASGENSPSHQPYSQQATILGAGLATRFERISGDSTNYSKPAVPLVGNRSVIACIADHLALHGFTHLFVNTYFKPESLKSSLANSKPRHIDYIDEVEPSGTAGGLRKMLTMSEYAGLLDLGTPLLVVQGDAVTDADFSALMEAHVAQNALVTVGCQTVAQKDVDKFGIIVTDQSGKDGQSGRITAFQEKPSQAEAKSLLGNTGFYIFSPRAFSLVRDVYLERLRYAQDKASQEGKAIPNEVSLDFANDIFPAFLERCQNDVDLGKFWAQRVEGYWSDIGNPVQYLESIHDVYAGKIDLPLPEDPGQYYRDGVIYWEGCLALAEQDGATLTGNVVVARPFTSKLKPQS